MWSTSSLPLISGPHWPGVVETVKVRSMGQIELFGHLFVKLLIEMFVIHKNN